MPLVYNAKIHGNTFLIEHIQKLITSSSKDFSFNCATNSAIDCSIKKKKERKDGVAGRGKWPMEPIRQA